MLDPTDLLTDEEAGALMRKGPDVVRRLRSKGELAFLPGKPPLTPREVVLEYLRRQITAKPKASMRVRLRR